MTHRFGWIGSARRGVLRGKLATCIHAWLADWHVADGGETPSIENAPIVPYSSDEAYVLQTAQPGLMVAVARDELARLGNWLASIRDSAATLSQDVGRAALEDLAQRVGRLVGKGEITEHGASAWPQGLTREELGAVGFMLDVGGMVVNLALSRDALDAACPPAPHDPHQTLRTRSDAVGTACVRLTARLDFGSISVRELADLRIGEVLVGECSLDAPIQVRAPGHTSLGSARMGRIDNRLAIVMTETSTSQESL